MTESSSTGRPDLRVSENGPLWRWARRRGLASPGLTPWRLILLALAVTWLPMLLLSSLQHLAAGHAVEIPFLRDCSAWGRYFVALPMLIAAEAGINWHLARASRRFSNSGLIRPIDLDAFFAVVRRVNRLADATLAEIALLLLALAISLLVPETISHLSSNWIGAGGEAQWTLSWAGHWRQLVSLPLYLFYLGRWVWRLLLWYWYLFQVNQIDLQLSAAHPDRAGGLGFLAFTQRIFAWITGAIGATSAGFLANQMELGQFSRQLLWAELTVLAVAIVLLFVAPLLMFSPRLYGMRATGLSRYGRLATEYVGEFEQKWPPMPTTRQAELLGSPDIQSLADLGNAFERVRETRPVVFGRELPLILGLTAALPFTPLLLTLLPFEEVVRLAQKLFLG